MQRIPRRAAAWAAPITIPNRFAKPAQASPKRTHKLTPMTCVMWLPDYGAYLKTVDLCAKAFTVSNTPEGALRLAEDLATNTGHALIEATGVRVQLRPFYESSSLSLN